MPEQPSQAAAELMRRAAAAGDTLQLEVPDESVRLPEPLVLRAREIAIRGAGPRAALVMRSSGGGSGAPLVIQPRTGAAVGRFTVEGLTLRIEISDDEGEWSCLRVVSGDDEGVAGGDVFGCRFEVSAPRTLRAARVTLCQVGAESGPRLGELRVRMVTIRDNILAAGVGASLCLAHVHGCRALRNVFADDERSDGRSEAVGVLFRGAQHCELRDNAIRRKFGEYDFVAFRFAGSESVPAVNNALRDNVVQLDGPSIGFDLREHAQDNVLERNSLLATRGSVGIRLAPGGGVIRGNWLFDNRVLGFAVAVRIEPGGCRANRLVNSASGAIEDASGGANVLVVRGGE